MNFFITLFFLTIVHASIHVELHTAQYREKLIFKKSENFEQSDR